MNESIGKSKIIDIEFQMMFNTYFDKFKSIPCEKN